MGDATQLRALYERMGGKDKLFAILKDFYDLMAKDVLIGFFFDGKNTAAIAKQQGQFLLQAMGVSSTYQGKIPTNAHLELAPILTGHFDRRLVLLRETLEKHGLCEEDIRTWINFENLFRDVVVNEKK